MATEPTPLRPDSRGYYCSQWRDDDGRRRTRTFGRDAAEAILAYEEFRQRWYADHGLRNPGRKVMLLGALIDQYVEHAHRYYRREDGTHTGEAWNIADALRDLQDVAGAIPVDELGPGHLRAFQQRRAANVARTTANKHVSIARRMIRWAVSHELAPPDVRAAWESVEPLRKGRSSAREPEPVDAVPEPHLERTLEYCPPTIAAMIRLQLLTGMRPGEVCAMTPADIQTTAEPWLYQPPKHKTAHQGRARRIYLGPEARDLLRYRLTGDLAGPLFRPADAIRERQQARVDSYEPPEGAHDYRQWPSSQQRRREAGSRERHCADRYTTATYRQAIGYAADAAGVPRWSPGQLRHNAEQRVERWLIDQGTRPELARDAARAMLGHSRVETTMIYAARDAETAGGVMERIG